MLTIGDYLDKLHPAACVACRTPYKRMEAKWMAGASRNVCRACGLDQASAEAGAIVKQLVRANLRGLT